MMKECHCYKNTLQISNNKCIVIEIESNISAVNNIVEINLQGKQIEQKNRLLINYLIMVQFVRTCLGSFLTYFWLN